MRTEQDIEDDLKMLGIVQGQEQKLQSVAEAVHLAIKLLEDGVKLSLEIGRDGARGVLRTRMEAITEELRPAMMILAPYMPNYSPESLSGLTEAPDGLSEENTGYLDGTDEKSYSARHV